jgi:hypothetical protein
MLKITVLFHVKAAGRVVYAYYNICSTLVAEVESQIMPREAGRNVTLVLSNENVLVHAMKSHGGMEV